MTSGKNLFFFHCQHDDGCRIYIDGQLRLDALWDSSFTGHDWAVTLSGTREVRIELYDSGGDAYAGVWWDTLTLRYNLATTVSPANTGTINRNVNPNCNGNQYTQGTTVALTANTNSGYTFDTWSGCDSVSGNTCNVTINSNRSVTANFRPSVTCYTLNTIANPTNGGSLSVLTSQNCAGGFLPGTSVQVRANPAFGYVLESWTGCDATSGNTCTITINSQRTVTANFVYAVRITAISPRAPYCVLRNATNAFERTLFIMGQNFETLHHLQFLKVATGETSIHFNMEVNWTSATNASVDIAWIKHLLWMDPKVALQVRITGDYNASYQPLSSWSSQFTLADNATVCGATQPVKSLFLPLVQR